MEVVAEPAELRQRCDEERARGKRIGFVPTMGALHDGHLSLVAEARRQSSFALVSIFVNPTQFGPSEDFTRYPRVLEADAGRCRAAGVDLVFTPDAATMYPPGEETRVRVGETAAHLCGAHRPGHFEGVATVVAKLLCLVGPCVAVFGRKDYQQLRVIERMATDLFLPVTIVGAPIVREPDGLAMSSRNRYLAPADRARALAIPRGLAAAARAFAAGERNAGALRARVRAGLEPAADSIDYVEVATADGVEPLADEAVLDGPALLAIAARIGGTRLIDNVMLGVDPPPTEEP
jgi:pantoate--beta-alanine ligase